MRALVTGATGALGPSIVQNLVQSGYQVRVLARSSPPRGLLPEQVSVMTGDITDPVSIRKAAMDCDFLFHLAARLHTNNLPSRLRKEYVTVNVEGTQNVVDAAQKADVGRLIYFSTISVYGPSRGAGIFDEKTRPAPQTVYAETKLAAEEIALGSCTSSGDPAVVVLRLAAAYGPRLKGNYRHLLEAVRRGLFVPIGPGDNRRTLVYVKDVARAALLAAESEQAQGNIYNVTDGQLHTFEEILQVMCSAVGKRPPRFHLPETPIRWMLRSIEKSFRAAKQNPPVSESLVDKLTEDVAVSGDKIQRELGFVPHYDLERGWKEVVQLSTEN